jgi:hypothetical protein
MRPYLALQVRGPPSSRRPLSALASTKALQVLPQALQVLPQRVLLVYEALSYY